MPWLKRDGISLFYEDAGGGGPPLLLVHGWGCDHTFMAPQFTHFCGDQRVVTVDLRLCEPRYASLPAIMKARKQPLEKLSAVELGVTLAPKTEVLEMQITNTKRECVRVRDVDELIEKLRGAGAI